MKSKVGDRSGFDLHISTAHVIILKGDMLRWETSLTRQQS